MIVRIVKNTKEEPIDTHIECEQIDIIPIYRDGKLNTIDVLHRNKKGNPVLDQFKADPLLCIFVMNDSGKTVNRYFVNTNGKWIA